MLCTRYLQQGARVIRGHYHIKTISRAHHHQGVTHCIKTISMAHRHQGVTTILKQSMKTHYHNKKQKQKCPKQNKKADFLFLFFYYSLSTSLLTVKQYKRFFFNMQAIRLQNYFFFFFNMYKAAAVRKSCNTHKIHGKKLGLSAVTVCSLKQKS